MGGLHSTSAEANYRRSAVPAVVKHIFAALGSEAEAALTDCWAKKVNPQSMLQKCVKEGWVFSKDTQITYGHLAGLHVLIGHAHAVENREHPPIRGQRRSGVGVMVTLIEAMLQLNLAYGDMTAAGATKLWTAAYKLKKNDKYAPPKGKSWDNAVVNETATSLTNEHAGDYAARAVSAASTKHHVEPPPTPATTKPDTTTAPSTADTTAAGPLTPTTTDRIATGMAKQVAKAQKMQLLGAPKDVLQHAAQVEHEASLFLDAVTGGEMPSPNTRKQLCSSLEARLASSSEPTTDVDKHHAGDMRALLNLLSDTVSEIAQDADELEHHMAGSFIASEAAESKAASQGEIEAIKLQLRDRDAREEKMRSALIEKCVLLGDHESIDEANAWGGDVNFRHVSSIYHAVFNTDGSAKISAHLLKKFIETPGARKQITAAAFQRESAMGEYK